MTALSLVGTAGAAGRTAVRAARARASAGVALTRGRLAGLSARAFVGNRWEPRVDDVSSPKTVVDAFFEPAFDAYDKKNPKAFGAR